MARPPPFHGQRLYGLVAGAKRPPSDRGRTSSGVKILPDFFYEPAAMVRYIIHLVEGVVERLVHRMGPWGPFGDESP